MCYYNIHTQQNKTHNSSSTQSNTRNERLLSNHQLPSPYIIIRVNTQRGEKQTNCIIWSFDTWRRRCVVKQSWSWQLWLPSSCCCWWRRVTLARAIMMLGSRTATNRNVPKSNVKVSTFHNYFNFFSLLLSCEFPFL